MTTDHPVSESVDTAAIAAKWLNLCGPCDLGLPYGCNHPDEDHRPVMSALVAEVERLRVENTRLREVAEAAKELLAINPSPRAYAPRGFSALLAAVDRAYPQEGGE